MNKNFFIPIVALSIIGSSCKEKEMKTLDLNNLNTEISPKEDFYEYACGGWIKNNPLKDEHARYSSFSKLGEDTEAQIKDIIEDLASANAIENVNAQKIATLYNVIMDTAKLNEQGYTPIKPKLQRIENLKTKQEALDFLTTLHKEGESAFFTYYVGADDNNSAMNMFHIYQAGTSLPSREYYLNDDEDSKKIRDAYSAHIVKMLQLCEIEEVEAKKMAPRIMDVETKLAEIQFSKTELRVPKNNFNRVQISELQELLPEISWDKYLGVILPSVKLIELDVSQMPFMKSLMNVLKDLTLEDYKAYYTWKTLNGAASYLSDEFVAQNFDFYGRTLSGQKEMRPRWKRAVNSVNSILGEAVGEVYVEKYFPQESKDRMLELVENIRKTMAVRFTNSTWMSEETKKAAHEKLAAIGVKIGYPDKWKDYSSLEIEDDSYYANATRSTEFELKDMLSEVNQPVDAAKWHMSPQTVNAYFSPSMNEICFPAGILQPPFFYSTGDDAINYGAIGVVIAHELTHGFDDQGRMFDKDGNVKDWWAKEDVEKFNIKSKILVDYFNNITVIDDLKANGEFTLGENIADNGGVNISYATLEELLKANSAEPIDAFTAEQRFFLSYANVWAGDIRPEEIRRLTLLDPHSLGEWRVNATLPHIDAFLTAFDIKEGDKMWLAPEKRALIW